MNYQDFVDIVVNECIEFADYLDYLPVDEFGEDEVMDSLKSSHNEKAKEALRFYRNLSVKKAEVLLEKVFEKLEHYYDDVYEEVDSNVEERHVLLEGNSMNRYSKEYDDFLYSGYGSSMSFEQYQRQIVGCPVTRFANNNDYDNWAGSGLGSSMSFNEYCRQNGLACGPGF